MLCNLQAALTSPARLIPVMLAGAVLGALLPPAVAQAGPAGPADPAQEVFTQPPRHETVAARQAVAVPGGNGAARRLVRPAAYTAPGQDLPDFENIGDIETRKVEFFSFLKPLVQQENERLLYMRRRLGYIRDHVRFKRPVGREDRAWLEEVAREFRVDEVKLQDREFWNTLLRRVDVLPEELVLVQAANESAWGTSRFAREGNNLFGQWCFRPGCGMVPAGRPEGATYEVAAFDSISESISSYMRNLNTGRVYRDLRVMRAECRAEGRRPEAAELAKGLTSYSERGMAYVTEIRAMLRHNAPVIAQLSPR